MNIGNFEIKLSDNHFKLEIGLRDLVAFENSLIEQNISFYREDGYDFFNGFFRFYFLNEDKPLIDQICVREKIIWRQP